MSTFNELIDFTRSTTGTYLDSVVYGPELITNGDFATDSDWIKTGNLTAISNGTATIGETAGNGSIRQEDALIAGKSYIVKFNITAVSSASAFLAFRNDEFSSVGSAVISFGSSLSVATYSKVFVATGSIVNFTVGGGNSSLTIANVSVKEIIGGQVSGTPLLRTAASNEPRLEYDASGNPLGLLIEEARTNLFINSIPNSGWLISNTTLSFNVAESPDGQATAGLFAETATVGAHMTYQSGGFNFVGGTAYTSSVYVKANTATSCQLTTTSSGFGTTAYANFDLSNGTLGTTGASATSSIQEIGNGWYRISMTATAGTSVSGSGGFIALNNNNPSAPRIPLYAGDTSQSIYVWGNQVETGSFPTSYIPTSGSTVTRAADVASLPVERFAYNDTKGSVVVSARPLQVGDPSGSQALLEIGTANRSKIYLFARLAGTSQSRFLANNGSNQADLRSSDFVGGSLSKMSAGWAVNNFAMSMDGGAAVVDTAGAVMTGCTIMGIGTLAIPSTNLINGHIKQIQYFPKRLSNEELELLTQPSASPTMNLTFDGQATSTLVEGLHD